MRQAAKYSALGFSATCFALAADAAMGLGTAQWLADLCLTEPAGSDMSDMEMYQVTPGPFLAVSIAMAGVGMGILVTEDREAALGLTPPSSAEHAGILSAIVMTAATTGKVTEHDIANIFQIVTGNALEPKLAELAFHRYLATDPNDIDAYAIEPSENPLARRRIMAAALMVGCVAHEPTARTSELIETLAFSTGSTPDDVAVAKAALQKWSDTDANLSGSPLITLLKTKPLGLRPA